MGGVASSLQALSLKAEGARFRADPEFLKLCHAETLRPVLLPQLRLAVRAFREQPGGETGDLKIVVAIPCDTHYEVRRGAG